MRAQTPQDASRPGGAGDAETQATMPASVGGYRLHHELGRGSMGTVFLADQEQPVHRQVALKVLDQRGTSSQLTLARFETERQALALMNHPGIATVYSAGTTDDGLPYVAMEVVQGEPITTYCDRHRLGVEQRLELFLQVCEAIQHAHQRMVIHRDIKPSNVLVTSQDGKAVAKVIDFGVALRIEGGPGRSTVSEQEHQLPVGTPLYMSPEQMGGADTVADVRADVYALGVLLYELLAGPVPFTAWTTELAQLLVRLLEYTPPPPSERLGRGLGDVATIAADRDTGVARLRRRLRGDLDSITMKAIAKDRAQRYGSVTALQADLLRHLRHEPLLVKAPTLSYRGWKFVRRYRGSVAVTVVIFLALLAVIAAYAAGLARTRRARDAAVKAEQRATATMEYLRRVLGSMDVGVDGHEVRVVDLLTRAAQMIDSDLAGQPDVEAEVRKSLGLSLLELGRFKDAGTELERAAELLVQLHGEHHPETLRLQNQLGRLRYKLGHFEEAAAIHQKVLAQQLHLLGEQHLETLWTMYNLAKDYHRLGRWQESEQLLRRNLAAHRQAGREGQLPTLVATNTLSLLLCDRGNPEQAAPLQRRCLQRLEQLAGASHTDTLRARANLVEILNHLGRYREAEQLSRATLELQVQVLGEHHPETLGTRAQLVLALVSQGKATEAFELGRLVLAVRRVRLGEQHPDTLETKVLIGQALTALGRFEEADAFLAEAVSAAHRVLPAGHWKTALFGARYGACLIKMGRFAEARRQLEQSERVQLQHHPLAAPATAALLQRLDRRQGRQPTTATGT